MNIANNPDLGRRYRLDKELGRGGMGVVYRAYDRLTGDAVALKTVTTLAPTIAQDSTVGTDFRLRLAHEFKIAASLCHPYVIRVLDYGFDNDLLPYFTMQLLDSAQPLFEPGTPIAFEHTLRLLLQTLQALTYLHRNHVLHLDLKPENVLIVQQQVKVVDFGIAAIRGDTHADENENISGTLTYIAPELLMGTPPSPPSDLYAVGIMFYELLTGQHPFDTTTASTLVRDTLYTPPDLMHPDIPDYLVPILEKLLHKDPEERYQDAAQVLMDLQEVVDVDFPEETLSIRESFLQSAIFVGRDEILRDLNNAFRDANEKKGSLWLIGGENGVGKSRLLSELHTQTLVRGALVLRGQAVQTGGNAYHLWADVVRRLVVMTDITEQEASILKPLIADMDALLERNIPPAPPLEGSAAQDRLADTLEKILARQSQPLVILLEDLHWADHASLFLLKHLQQTVIGKNWLVVATYRDDEAPDLPEQFPSGFLARLMRLNTLEMSQLCQAILGSAGQRSDLLELLRRETDGNVLFMVEILRTLADEAGNLDRIQEMQLPESILSGGIVATIQHRLKRIPDYALYPLRLAAIMGRELDLTLLQTALPDLKLDKWLLDCNYASVLEVEGDEWHFNHNRMRDILIGETPPELTKELHRRTADAIIKLYGHNYAHPGAMALHLEQAGDYENAARWYLRAGKKAELAYAPQEAIHCYRQTLKYLPQTNEYQAQFLIVYDGLGKMLRWQAQFDEAHDIYATMRDLAQQLNDPAELSYAWTARALIGLSDVQNSQGKRDESSASALQARDIAELAGDSARTELTDALGNIAWGLYRKGEYAEAQAVAERGLHLSQSLNLSGQIGRNLNTLSIVHFMQGAADKATEYMQQALNIARELGDRRDIAIKLNNLGEFERLTGKYNEAIPFYTQALEIFQAIGYRDAELAILTNLGSVNVALRQYARAEEWLERVIERTAGTEWWGLSETYLSLAEARLAQGKGYDAIAAGVMALREGQKSGTPIFIGRVWRTLGRIADNVDEPIEVLDETYSVTQCYEKSYALFEEQGDEKEQITTLELWSDWEMQQGDVELGLNLQRQMTALQQKLNG